MAMGITRTQRILLRGSLRCMAVFGPLVAAFQIANAVGGEVLSRTIGVSGGRPVPGTRRGAYVYQSAVRVDLLNANASVWLQCLLPTVLLALAVTVTGFLLLRILYETDAGQPFFDSSARRLRTISAVIAVAAIAVPIASAIADDAVLATARPRLQSDGPDFSVIATWLVVALVVRVVAEAFRIGTQLRDETEGLV